MKNFDGILICTDLDGTLLRKDKTVSKENLEAIEYFKANGGLFTFITGRMHFYVRDIYDVVKPNAPIGTANGAGIYDYTTNQYLWYTCLSNSVLELLEFSEQHLPDIGFLINTPDEIFFCNDNSAMVRFRKITKLPNNICYNYKNFDKPISKIIYADDSKENIDKLEKLLKTHPLWDKFDFVRSSRDLFEIVPKGHSKGTVLVRLADILGVEMDKTIAIGDYDNDISMLSYAGTGVAVSNACDAAKAAADYITVSNEEHAIAKIISDIENCNS